MRELHPLPKAEYSLNLLTGAKSFSKLDANSGFWQIPLDKKSSYLTIFMTPFGRFRFQRLSFGISSAPKHFQRRMSQMLEGIPGTICHMDAILIWGSTQEEHDQRLTEVCKRLKNSGMTLNAKKGIFSQTSIKFLGHIIDGQGIHPDPDKIAAIENYQPPTNKKELKQLLGLANYLARFVPNYSDILFPLTSMLSNNLLLCGKRHKKQLFRK
ncbi:Retrovirus-related Pol polyprotein from transposon 17.6 [Araneus ventricosus]|uniref:Retrovirus-related Pol polyprotein from transposon 17.6 n=1 Tax=Araneus ventricosus TaxID=182803 RepID=A0A4Y2EEB9_ARAVE|nr:Retrovirus-related Pol polyprotein from transposon 17.6 [Araneus ventricosus]